VVLYSEKKLELIVISTVVLTNGKITEARNKKTADYSSSFQCQCEAVTQFQQETG
jgi:hypothetical protein